MLFKHPLIVDLPNFRFVTIHSDSFRFVIFSWAHQESHCSNSNEDFTNVGKVLQTLEIFSYKKFRKPPTDNPSNIV